MREERNDARSAALRVLRQMDRAAAWADAGLDAELRRSSLAGQEAALAARLVYGVLQMFLGMKNVMYGRNFWEVLAIILLDYVVAFGVIGLAGIFDKCIKNRPVSIAVGSVFATLLRLACHFVSGWIIWEALWPNELGWASPLWSLAYNASYMIPEMIITTVAAVALYFPLKKYYYGEDLK